MTQTMLKVLVYLPGYEEVTVVVVVGIVEVVVGLVAVVGVAVVVELAAEVVVGIVSVVGVAVVVVLAVDVGMVAVEDCVDIYVEGKLLGLI